MRLSAISYRALPVCTDGPHLPAKGVRTAVRLRFVSAAIAFCACICLIGFGCPQMVLADEASDGESAETDLVLGGVTLTETEFSTGGDSVRIYQARQGDYSNLHPKRLDSFPYAYLCFDKNVGYAQEGQDDAFVKNNEAKVHLTYADGTLVEDAFASTIPSMDYRRIIGVYTPEWLKPLTEYRIVVEPGIMAANGRDVSDQEYVIEFKTGAECSDGMTVYEKVALGLFGIAIGCGVAVGIVRVVRRRS